MCKWHTIVSLQSSDIYFLNTYATMVLYYKLIYVCVRVRARSCTCICTHSILIIHSSRYLLLILIDWCLHAQQMKVALLKNFIVVKSNKRLYIIVKSKGTWYHEPICRWNKIFFQLEFFKYPVHSLQFCLWASFSFYLNENLLQILK